MANDSSDAGPFLPEPGVWQSLASPTFSKDPAMQRCDWAAASPLETQYHDEQWGVPVHDDRPLFEMLVLEGAQAGLSWSTILKKREGYREAFDNFNPETVAGYTEATMERLLRNPGIIRNRAKVYAAVTNAQRFLDVRNEFGSFDAYIWSFVDGAPVNNAWETMADTPAQTPTSEAMSKDLKKRGFKFVGPTICYAFMQAVGIVNDHLVTCFRYPEIVKLHHAARSPL